MSATTKKIDPATFSLPAYPLQWPIHLRLMDVGHLFPHLVGLLGVVEQRMREFASRHPDLMHRPLSDANPDLLYFTKEAEAVFHDEEHVDLSAVGILGAAFGFTIYQSEKRGNGQTFRLRRIERTDTGTERMLVFRADGALAQKAFTGSVALRALDWLVAYAGRARLTAKSMDRWAHDVEAALAAYVKTALQGQELK